MLGQNYELQRLQEKREEFHKKTCLDDSSKFNRCNKKLNEYLLLKKKYLTKADSFRRIVQSKNKMGSKYHFYIQTINPVYFDWGECNQQYLGNGRTIIYESLMDSSDDYIDADIKIGKSEELRVDNTGLKSGRTFYLEDFDNGKDILLNTGD